MPSVKMRVVVEGPTAIPLPYGLLSAAVVVDSNDPHEMAGTSWMSFICGEAGITDWCPEEIESPSESPGESPGGCGEEKSFNKPDIGTTPPVIIYYGAECAAIGYDYDQAVEHANVGLRLGEQKTLEQWVMQELLSKQAVNLTPDLTPLALPVAIAAVESGLADRYGGMGVIHAPAGVAAMLGNAKQIIQDGGGCAADGSDGVQELLNSFVPGRVIRPCGNGYHTWLGHRVALGVGYQNRLGPVDEFGVPQIAPPGSAWIYASGPVVVRRSEVIVSPPTDGESFNTRTNDRNVVAERGFVVEISCAIVAALADVSCCC